MFRNSYHILGYASTVEEEVLLETIEGWGEKHLWNYNILLLGLILFYYYFLQKFLDKNEAILKFLFDSPLQYKDRQK